MQLAVYRSGLQHIVIECIFLIIFLCAGLISRVYVLLAGAMIMLVLIVLTIFFFRNPERIVKNNIGLVLSPADGRIKEVHRNSTIMPSIGNCTMISIYLSLWNVHVNRIPVSGEVIHRSCGRGKYLPAFSNKAGKKNAFTLIQIKNGNGLYAVKQMTGFLARRIICEVVKGDFVSQGNSFGIIQFGSRVNLYLPSSIELTVQRGDRVKGGQTIIGTVNVE